jgi:putative holliday junction resolvase
MKILSLDLGDKWTGSALSDALHISCKPYKTIETENLESSLKTILTQENIDTVVVGYPKTLKGKESQQTKKVIDIKERLDNLFGIIDNKKISWILWDERLSSKRAQTKIPPHSSRETKLKEHSIAAAFILQSYLDYKALNK